MKAHGFRIPLAAAKLLLAPWTPGPSVQAQRSAEDLDLAGEMRQIGTAWDRTRGRMAG